MIKKEDVIKMIDEWLERLDESDVSEAIECVLLMVKNHIENMPEAVKSGEWKNIDDTFICSVCECGFKNQPTLMGKPMFDFCPVCGADMRKKVK